MVNPWLPRVERRLFLDIPVDCLEEIDADEVLEELLNLDGPRHIVFLGYKEFRRARRDREYADFLRRAALVLPVNISLTRGMRFLGHPAARRWHPFDFIIRLFGRLETRNRTLYVVGGRLGPIQTVAANLKASFPRLRLVGRHIGFFPKDQEEVLLTAARKATPDVVFAGPGLPGRDRWVFRRAPSLGRTLLVWSAEAFRIMARQRPRVAPADFAKGTWGLKGLWYKPWRWLKAFSYASYGFLLLFAKIFKKE